MPNRDGGGPNDLKCALESPTERAFLLHCSTRAAGLSGSCVAKSNSTSSLPAFRVLPLGEKASSDWVVCRLSLSRSTSYLPLLSFGPSAPVPGSAYPLLRLSASECLISLADGRGLLCPLPTSALRSDRLSMASVAETTQSRSPRVSSAAFRAQSSDLRFAPLMDMDFAVSWPLVRC